MNEEVSGALPVHHRPTNDAVRMANANLLEQLPGMRQFRNASRFAAQIGISKSVLSDLLAMLNKPVKVIERLLFEMKKPGWPPREGPGDALPQTLAYSCTPWIVY